MIQIDVVRHEQIEISILVEVDKRASGVPAGCLLNQVGFQCGISKSPTACVEIQNILPVVGDEQILMAVIVNISDTNPLSPARAGQPSLFRDILENAFSEIAVQMVGGLLALWKTFKCRSIHQKHIQQVVLVVVEQSHPTAVDFNQIFLTGFTACDMARRQPCVLGDVDVVNG